MTKPSPKKWRSLGVVDGTRQKEMDCDGIRTLGGDLLHKLLGGGKASTRPSHGHVRWDLGGDSNVTKGIHVYISTLYSVLLSYSFICYRCYPGLRTLIILPSPSNQLLEHRRTRSIASSDRHATTSPPCPPTPQSRQVKHSSKPSNPQITQLTAQADPIYIPNPSQDLFLSSPAATSPLPSSSLSSVAFITLVLSFILTFWFTT